MKIDCPHCKKSFETNIGRLMGMAKSKKKAEASRRNGRKHKSKKVIDKEPNS